MSELIKLAGEPSPATLEGMPFALQAFVLGWLERPYKTMTMCVPWEQHDTSAPVETLATIQGWGDRDGDEEYHHHSGAVAFMNPATFAHALANRNRQDLGGILEEGGAEMRTLEGVNRVLARVDLPTIEVFDRMVFEGTDEERYVIRDGVVIIAGRDLETGDFRFTTVHV